MLILTADASQGPSVGGSGCEVSMSDPLAEADVQAASSRIRNRQGRILIFMIITL